MIEQCNDFKAEKGEWEMHFQLRQQSVYIMMHSKQMIQTYEAEMTLEKIKEDKNFNFFFEDSKDLFKFLQASYRELEITKDGCIVFIMGMPVGKIVKNIQFRIPTCKKEVDKNLILERKINAMEKSLEQVKQENQQLLIKSNNQQIAINNLKDELTNVQKALSQKDEVLNSIFSELNEISKWREDKERRIEELLKNKRKFVADEMNSHNIKFVNIANRYRKNCGGSWDVLICKYQMQRNEVYRYAIKQVRAGNNGSFMYGLGTASIRGINRAQDHKEFIGYYENTGNVYNKGESQKGGSKIKDGQTICIEVDTRNWKISWQIQGKKQAEISIIGELRLKPLFLAIIAYNQDSEIEFV